LFDPPIGPMGYQRLLSHDRRPYKTSDGFICVMIYTDLQWERFLPAVDMPRSILDAPKFRSISARTENIDELYAMVARKLEGLSTADCAFRLEAADVPFSVLNSLESLVVDPHLQAVDFFETTAHPSEGDLRMPSATAMFSSSESRPAGPAPRLGEHSREILVDLGYAAHEVQALIDGGVSRADGDGRPGSGG
jgi:crotonobetainyl-CoA:carnitine CoA-transferase CaiB-like acyl-CoA transferase